MFSHLERPTHRLAGPGRVLADLGGDHAAHGFIGWLFAATAPVAIILSVGAQGGLSEATLASWIFGIFVVNGVLTLLFSWIYRQPLALFWTIPGTVLVGPALGHLSFPEVVGAFHVTGLLIVVLGMTGWVRRAMRSVPMPIVMGMVAGVFLRFGLDLVRALRLDVAVAGPMVAAWLALCAVPALGRRVPPILGALFVGVVAAIVFGRFDLAVVSGFELARPEIVTPVWSWAAMVELVIPLAITVLVVQNGQGLAVLRGAGHEPPVDAVTVACGVGSIAAALVGGVCTCLAGPTNAILVSSGGKERQYTAAMTTGVLSIGFGLVAPALTRVLVHAPKAFVMTLAGLAMLRVLQSAFHAAFRDRFTLGAIVAFLVTVADIGLLDIGAAFWGLVAGVAVSWLLERHDFVTLREGSA